MKKTSLYSFLVIAFLLAACKNQNQEITESKESTEIIHENTDAHHESELALDNEWIHEIQLDNGKKWQANIETTQGVQKMMNLIEETKTESVEDYHQLASKLNDEKNIIIKECDMEGPSHDNLHVFLHPLIDKIAALQKTESVEDAQNLKESIKENLKKYSDYFL